MYRKVKSILRPCIMWTLHSTIHIQTNTCVTSVCLLIENFLWQIEVFNYLMRIVWLPELHLPHNPSLESLKFKHLWSSNGDERVDRAMLQWTPTSTLFSCQREAARGGEARIIYWTRKIAQNFASSAQLSRWTGWAADRQFPKLDIYWLIEEKPHHKIGKKIRIHWWQNWSLGWNQVGLE